ncbi:siderophore-interacting protein [Paracoccus contaminans]|uniref:Siderophore-interacting protein n=1 Tax=Paracoccus contaminans TaxID=1945662 RepID=A0A1W6D142_9RHOB|nr:siderophore-interacting protein [Paracoccus contaminans]
MRTVAPVAHLRTHGTSGIVTPRSGAAAAALRLRAAAWEIELTELPGQISLRLWGCDLRLVDDALGLRLVLSGPERRLVDTLRDCAAEMMAEAGLSIAWDRVDAGALAPGLSLATVVGVRRRTPSFWRVRLAGPDLERFTPDAGLHFRLLIPPAGRDPVWPRVAASGRTAWPEGADSLHRAVYTLSDCGRTGGTGWIEFDACRHSPSPTCNWIEGGALGKTVGVLGPGGGTCPQARRLWLFGDETALPAIGRMLPMAQGQARAVLRAEPADLGALAGDARVTRCDDLLDALLGHPAARRPDEGAHVWFAGRADQARAARAHLLACGWNKASITCAAYWG